ncbi:MAG: sulfite exporter TauE/SafE family protein [Oscillospiraceae bacterium]|nr:sulfite exporter TauE/SafE family protein [Oscillospiraceae bacterium]
MNWLWISLAGLLSGMAGAMGLGGGGVLLIYLTVFAGAEQLNAQGINLIFFIPIAILSMIIYAKNGQINWGVVIKTALCGLIGAFAGSFFAGFIGGELLSKLFACMLVILGVYEFFVPIKKSEDK